jgi:monoterpene epsilon-lactone hydrolase
MADSPALEKVRNLYRNLIPTDHEASIDEFRQLYDDLCNSFTVPAGTEITPVDAGGVSCLSVLAQGASAGRTVVFFHSGGYVIGSAHGYRQFGAALSAAADARVLVVDYRRAPEHPYPAALDDGVAAIRWAMAQAGGPDRVVVAGDSAGGGLTVAALVALRNAGGHMPVAGVCISPWVDLACEGDTMKTKADVDPIVAEALVLQLAEAYLQGADPKQTPLASPLYADLSGLPPLLVLVGEAETLLDDSVRLVEKIGTAGGRVEFEMSPDMVHIWPLFNEILPEGAETVTRVGRWIQERTPA